MTSTLVSYSYYEKSYSYSCDLRWHPLRSSHRAITIQISFPKPPNCDDFYRDRWQRSILSYFFCNLKWSNLILTLLILVGHFQCKFIISKHQILPTFRGKPLARKYIILYSSSSHSVSTPSQQLFTSYFCIELHALVWTLILTSFLSGYLCFIINSMK